MCLAECGFNFRLVANVIFEVLPASNKEINIFEVKLLIGNLQRVDRFVILRVKASRGGLYPRLGGDRDLDRRPP